MNVPAPGGPAIPDPRALQIQAEPLVAGAVKPISRAPEAPADRILVSFDELTAAPLQQLLETIENRLFPAGAPVSGHGGGHAGGHQNITAAYNRAMQAFAESADGALENDARQTALKSLEKAARALDLAAGPGPRIPDSLDPRTVLALGYQLMDTGQVPNYLRANELASEIASWYDGPLTLGPGSRAAADLRAAAGRGGGMPGRLEFTWFHSLLRLSKRAPVLMLLAAWLALGLGAAAAVRLAGWAAYESSTLLNAWGMGFLALVVAQFILSVRGALRPKRRG